MGLYAVIRNSIVDGIAIADAALDTDGEWVCIDGIEPQPGPNWRYENGIFSSPIPPPETPKTYTRLQLIDMFGSDYNNILTASKTDVEVEIWLEKFRLKDLFVVTDNTFINDINSLVTKNLINQTKANSILT